MKRELATIAILSALALGALAAGSAPDRPAPPTNLRVVGQTITASGGSAANVQIAIDQANDGDTVVIPAGSYTWASGVTIKKAITLDGSGSIITDGAGSNDLLSLTTSPNGHLTVANIKFLPGSATGRYMNIGQGSNAQGIILHDLTFEIPHFQLTSAITCNIIGGLLYNCTFESHSVSTSQGPGSGSGCLQVRSPKNWYDADSFGDQDRNGDQNLYVEDSTFTSMRDQAIDIDDNARVVLRHCQMNSSQCVTHGITSAWGGRLIEFYNNTFSFKPVNGAYVNINRWFWARAGSGRIHDNVVDKISSSDWGTKVSFVFIDEPLTRPGSGNGGQCETQSQYPGTRWPGTGSFTDGHKPASGQVVSPSQVNPFYLWANTGTGATSWGTNDQSGYSCNNGPTSAVFKIDRDIKFAAPAGYTPYTYPHPWRSGGPAPTPTPAPTATPAPTPTPAPTATPTPTPTPTPAPAGGDYSDWLNQLSDWIRTHPAKVNSAAMSTQQREAEQEGTEPVPGPEPGR
jgi:hypothetical protein